jgi:two-component system response regulator YesN
MYKLMIADDEPRIRDGLQKLLDWDKYNITIVGIAEDGEMAFHLAKEKQPDILFLDVCMPFLNGLDLVKKLNSVIDNCVIIIITGYTEFSYLQKALQLRVFDYLLKPITERGLEETVRKAIEEIDKKRQNNKYNMWVNEKLEGSIDFMREKFFINLIKDRISDEQIIKDISFMDIKLLNKIGLLIMKIMYKPSLELDTFNDIDKNLMIYGIKNIITEIIGDSKLHACFFDELNNVVVVANIGDILDWSTICDNISCNIESYIDAPVLFEMNIPYDIMNVASEYKKLCLKLKEKSSYKPVVVSIINYIQKNFQQKDLSLEKIAKEFNMSSSYLSKLLKSEVGSSFVDILTKVRVQKATALINSSSVKMYEVAELVGYGNQYYFSRAFKKATGISPVQYKGEK